MPKGVPTLTCARCTKPMHNKKGSRPQGEATCHRCRARERENTCEECGTAFRRQHAGYRFCSTRCSGDYQSRTRQVRAETDCRVQRTKREHAAPGLSPRARRALLAQYRKQKRPCAYCPAPADTVDHVVPLVRGGTNHEGNLVPACRRCNSSKSGRTVMEWRTGRKLPRMTTAVVWAERPKKCKPAPKTPTVRLCALCAEPTTRPSHCSKECATERQRRHMRDKYRAAHGIAVNPAEPTSKWAKR